MRLSEKARKNKVAYNVKRNREKYSQFAVKLYKQDYNDLCDYLKTIGMNKTEFVKWAYEKLLEENQ